MVNLLRFLNCEIVLVSDELYSIFKLKNNLTLLRNFQSFSDIELNKSNKDFIYFGRLENSKGVELLYEHWKKILKIKNYILLEMVNYIKNIEMLKSLT